MRYEFLTDTYRTENQLVGTTRSLLRGLPLARLDHDQAYRTHGAPRVLCPDRATGRQPNALTTDGRNRGAHVYGCGCTRCDQTVPKFLNGPPSTDTPIRSRTL